MANEYISQIQLQNNKTYNIRDKELIPRLKATVGHSNKNLLKIKANTQTINGVTFTVDKQAGTITINGQVESSASMAQLDLFPRQLVNSSLNGLILTEPASKTIPNYGFRTAIAYYNSSGTYISEQVINSGNPNPVVVSVPSNAYTYKVYVRATTSAGTLNNLVIKPMLRDGNIIDDSFEPYQEPTDSLIETKARAYLNSTVGHACKNLLDLTKYRASTDITDIVIDPETGSVSANASGTYKSIYFIDENIQFENGKTYVISCTNNAVNASGSLSIRKRVTFNIYKSVSFNTLGVKSITFTPNTTDFPNGWMISLFITKASGADSNIDISELMLKEVSISDDTFEPYQEPTDSLIETKSRAYLNSTVGHACKNFLNLKNLSSVTRNGVTWTVDPVVGTITANGTATAQSQYGDVRFTLSEGNYYFSGCPSGGDPSTYDVYAWDYTTNSRPKEWDGSTNAPSDFDGTKEQFQVVNNHKYGLTCRVEPGVTVNNLVFKPMVWDGSISDDTFEPYQEPTDSLIETKARAYLNSSVGHSSKNLFQITADTRTINGVTFTVDKQAGTVTANGTASKYTVFGLISPSSFYQERGMILSGCTDGSRQTYWIDTWDGSVQISNFSGDTGISTQSWTQVRIVIREGVSVSNLVFKPMIRDGSISDDTFEPYQTPTDEAKQDKPVLLYDAGESSVGVHSVTGLSNLTQYSELHITLFSPLNGDKPDNGITHTIVRPFIFPYNPENQSSFFDCWIMAFIDGAFVFKRVGIYVGATNTEVRISGEIDEQTGEPISIPSNHYIYIKRIVGIP